MTSLLPLLFAEKLTVDDRPPIATFAIPGVQGNFALYAPMMLFWIQLTTVRSVLMYCCCSQFC